MIATAQSWRDSDNKKTFEQQCIETNNDMNNQYYLIRQKKSKLCIL